MLNLSKLEKQKIIELLKKEPTKAIEKLCKRIEKSMQPIKPRSAKNKGLEWQKECAAMIARVTDVEYNQQDDDCEIHSRESGLNGVDVILRGRAKKSFPFCVECKNVKAISLVNFISQATSNCDELNNWILFLKSPRLPDKKVIIMDFQKFEEIIKPYAEKRKNML